MLFFCVQVCTISPQAAAITSFFRILSVPAQTLNDLSTLLAWDLEPTLNSHPRSLPMRVGLVSFAGQFPEPSVVMPQPNEISLQFIFPRPVSFEFLFNPIDVQPNITFYLCLLSTTTVKRFQNICFFVFLFPPLNTLYCIRSPTSFSVGPG